MISALDAESDLKKDDDDDDEESKANTQASLTGQTDLKQDNIGETKIAEDENEDSKYMLLDRLFKFIRTEEKPLNPVLAGSFFRLVNLLITRKQKQLVPYIFGDESDVIDCLLNHVY